MMLSPTNATTTLVWLLTGVFLLLYGVRLVSDTLQRAISGRMRQALTRLANNRLATFALGIGGSAAMQSSTAMGSLLVELVSADLLPLSAAIVMVLGANVGSTLVVQLLALHITDYAFDLLGVAVVVALFTHRTAFRRSGRALFAFALIILGLAVISTASQPFAQNPVTKEVLTRLEDAQLILVIIGAVLAIVFSSSAATIGLVLTLAANGALHPIPALLLMLGANVGTTMLTLLSSLNQRTLAGRRLALVHSSTKLLGAVLLMLLVEPLAALLGQIWPHDPGAQVAFAHMGFNIALALLFVPLSGLLARLMEQILPDKSKNKASGLSCRTLDLRALDTPEVAQALATHEILYMTDIVAHMFEQSMQAFKEEPSKIQSHMEAMDDQLDELDAAIKGYLTQVDEKKMTEEEKRRDIALLTIIGELEAIGDVIKQRIMSVAHRKSRGRITFAEESWEDLLSYYQRIKEVLQHVMVALGTHKAVMATKVMARKKELREFKRYLQLRHIRQLRAKTPNSKESSAIYLDLLDAMSTVLAHTSAIARILQETSSVNLYSIEQFSQEEEQSQFKTPRVRLHSLNVPTPGFAPALQSQRTEQLASPRNWVSTEPLHWVAEANLIKQ